MENNILFASDFCGKMHTSQPTIAVCWNFFSFFVCFFFLFDRINVYVLFISRQRVVQLAEDNAVCSIFT